MRLLLTLLFIISSAAYAANTKVGLNYLDMVYTINLPQSVERKEHVVKEFNRLGISNYTIFAATDKDSVEVTQLMQSNFVKKYPPCFRCNKTFCKCKNNVLIRSQIGNWLSFINVFKDIIKNNYNYVLITEDDVKFTPEAKTILDGLINDQNFAKYGVNHNKPVLIRLATNYAGTLQGNIKNIHFNKNIDISNPCFIVNKQFAITFLKHLKQINTTSDVYIHKNLLDLETSIQHFSASPMPAYELSDGNTAIFPSTIHPKGIDNDDLIRKQNHKKRVEFHEYLWGKICFWNKEANHL